MGVRPHVFDLHCDTIDALAMRDVAPFDTMDVTAGDDLASSPLALDLTRMHEVGPWAQCLAVFVPDDLAAYPGDALAFYRHARDYFKAQMAAHPGIVAQARDAREVEGILSSGRVAALLTVENGSPIGSDLGVIDEFAADGVKMVTLTWNGRNTIGSGHDTHEGLSALGREAVRMLEDRKVVVDVSHLNDEGFWDLMQVVRRPIAASHSNARPVCGHLRNLTDDQFRAIVDCGGIVGLNYCTGFVREGAWDASLVSFDDLAVHIEHFLDLGGERTMALGSDFDGCTTPAWLKTCADMPSFFQLMTARFGEELARRIFFQNAHDFFVRNETA